MKNVFILFVLGFLLSTANLPAQNYYFLGYADSLWSNTQNWNSVYEGYPGTTIEAGKYCRVSSNWSQGRCSLDVNIVNNGRLLLQSKFYLNGHTVTNNDLIEITGIIYGDVTNEPSGTLSPGWEPLFPTRQTSMNGSLTNEGKIPIDFDGSDNSQDYFYGITVANLGGELEIRFKNGFVPTLHTDYIIIYANSVVGTFDSVIWPTGVTGNVIYTSNRLKVNFTSLPVELVDFEAFPDKEEIRLEWSTATEYNSAGFDIQKSENGIDWKYLDFVPGLGNAHDLSTYHYVDSRPHWGLNYYRLKQIDFDGTYQYSKVIAAECNPSQTGVAVFPNPSTGMINIKIDQPIDQKVRLELRDHLGKRVWERVLEQDNSHSSYAIHLREKGLYFLSIINGRQIQNKRIVIVAEN